MKVVLSIIFCGVLFGLLSVSADAAICELDDAKVTNVFQWDDGSMFVVFDKPLGCGCLEDSRAGFHKNDDEKFFISGALTALTTGKHVFVHADNESGGCPIHGNTARLKAFGIKDY